MNLSAKTIKTLTLLSLCFIVAACGSGGGDTSPVTITTSETGTDYTGQRNKALLSEDNSLAFIQAFFGNNINDSLISRPLTAGEQKLSAFHIQNLLSSIGSRQHVKQLPGEHSTDALRRAVSESESCVGGGSLTVTGDIDERLFTGFLTYTFQNCTEDDISLSGKIQMDIFEYSQESDAPVSYDLRFDNLSMSNSAETASLTGVQSYREDSNHEPTVTTNLVRSYNGQQAYYKNLQNAQREYQNYVSGSIYLSNLGYVDITTPEPAILGHSSGFLTQGKMLFTGAASSTLTFEPVASSGLDEKMHIGLDADGDGIYESIALQNSNNLGNTSVTFSENTTPAIPSSEDIADRYAGNTAQARLTDSNGMIFVRAFFGNPLESRESLESRPAASQSDTISIWRLQDILWEAGRRLPTTRALQRRITHDVRQCSGGGSVTAIGEQDDVLYTGLLSYTYQACIEDDVQLSGRIHMNIHEFDQSNSKPSVYDLIADNLVVTDAAKTTEVLGIQSFNNNFDTGSLTTTSNLIQRDNGREIYTNNLSQDFSNYDLDTPVSVSGRLYISDHGYVDITTAVPLSSPYFDSAFFNQGEIHLSGENDSGIRLTNLWDHSAFKYWLRVDLDADGDGIYESLSLQDTETLFDDSAVFNGNRPPVISFSSEMSDRYNNEIAPNDFKVGHDLQLSSEVTDPDNVGIAEIIWTLESAPAGSTVALENYVVIGDIQPVYSIETITPDVAGEYSISVKAVDKDGLSQIAFFNVTVAANEAPTAVITSTDFSPLVAGEAIYLNAYGSQDPEEDHLVYQWDITPVDDNVMIPPFDPDTATGLWHFIPDTEGEFIVTLTVTDPWGSSHSTQKTVVIAPAQVVITSAPTAADTHHFADTHPASSRSSA